MNFEPGQIYHIYNRGNQKQTIFFSESHYILFLKKIREQLLPYCDILAWCLMPNHFHLMIVVTQKGCAFKLSGANEVQELSYRIGIMLSSFSFVVNKDMGLTGSLFQKKTKAKHLDDVEYVIRCMHYIHQNPLIAGLTNGKLEDWKYSSFRDYSGLRNGNLCNSEKLSDLTAYDREHFLADSYEVIDEKRSRWFY